MAEPAPFIPRWRRALPIVAVSFGTMLVVIDGGIANVALPTIARDLHVDSSAAVLIVTVYQLVFVMALLPLSAVGERIGLRKLYQWGQIAFAAASLLAFFANSLEFLLVVRVLQALGAGAVLSVSSAMIRSIYKPQHLGRGLGLNSVVVASSTAFAQVLGGMIISVASWPWLFAAAAPAALVSLALGQSLPNPPGRREPFDFAGALLCAASLGLIISGAESAVHGTSPVVSAAVVAIGIALGVALVRNQWRQPRPVLPIDLLVQPVIALSAIGAFAVFVGSMAFQVALPFRLHDMGFSGPQIGTMMAPWALTALFAAPIAGVLSDKYPAGLLGGIGMAVAAASLVCLALLPAHPSYFDIAWRMSLSGAGYCLFMSPNARLVVGSAPKGRAASAGALVSTIRLTGQTSGATLAAALLALGIGSGPVPPLIAAGLCVVAGICSISRLNPAIRAPRAGEVETSGPTGTLT